MQGVTPDGTSLRVAQQQRLDERQRRADRNRQLSLHAIARQRVEQRSHVRMAGRIRRDTTSQFSNAEPHTHPISCASRRSTTSTPQLQLDAIGGYEQNHFPLEDVHGCDLRRRIRVASDADAPNVVGNWEHRFFGGAYLLYVRSPHAAFGLEASASRATSPAIRSSSPTCRPEAMSRRLLNTLFLTTIPDPTQRQQTIDQFIRDRGLPAVLSSARQPVFAADTCCRNRRPPASACSGARNTVLLTVFNVRSEPISASGDIADRRCSPTRRQQPADREPAWSGRTS